MFDYGSLLCSLLCRWLVIKIEQKIRFLLYICRSSVLLCSLLCRWLLCCEQTPGEPRGEQMLPASDGKLRQTLIGARLKLGHDKVSTSSLHAVSSGSATRTPLKIRRTNVALGANV